MTELAQFKILGDTMLMGFAVLKDTLPLLTTYKVKTKNNAIILGKWQTKN